MVATSTAQRDILLPTFRAALDFAAGQCERLIAQHPGYTPMYTVNGLWNREGERWTHWCEGFYPGIFWLLHKQSGQAKWRERADRYSRPLEPRRHDRTVHDLGFLFFSTYLRWYNLTGDPGLKQLLIDAGQTLALRRQKGGYLASFVGPQSLFIDIMMNVGIILWAANATNDDSLRQIALEHCRTSAKHLVRPDGSTAHEALFDSKTGKFLNQTTHQGWNGDSTWTRGLAWAIYGFTAVHRLSEEEEFLDVARLCADCYLRRSPPGLVPPWDFDLPTDVPQLYDSSAAAIAASGLWDLAEAVHSSAEQERYRTAALTMLKTLCSDEFLPRGKPEWEGILMHGIYHYHKNLGVDESVAWGDHFFVEALVKAIAGRSDAAWGELMRIAVLSDSHGRNQTVTRALAEVRARGVTTVLHCGDIEDPQTIALFDGFDAHFVLGNCDWDPGGIKAAIEQLGSTFHDGFGDLEIDGKKIAFLHGHEKGRMRDLENSGYFDYLFYGHTHVAKEHLTGPTRVINPGALHRANPKTFVVVDLVSGEVESVIVG